MDYEQITEKVNKRLSEERFQHSKRAAEIASLLAARIGYDAHIDGMIDFYLVRQY